MKYNPNLVIEVKQATKQGYIDFENGGVLDLNYIKSKTRRGRVQGGGHICPTVTATDFEIYRCIVLERGTDGNRGN